MYTIIDYLKLYKDITLEKTKWNVIDNLMCSIIAYLPMDFSGTKDLDAFYDYSIAFKTKKTKNQITAKTFEVLELIHGSKRYKNLKISNVVNLKNEYTQFGALTIRIKNNTIISFKGTDGSLIGWIENFRLGYKYPTNTQMLATNYLNKFISLRDRNIYVVGHSKGGNLAMASAMECNNIVFNKIKKVYNFDGPGFMKETFESDKYDRLRGKLVNIVPTGSLVGVTLYNENYKAVKSSSSMYNEHYPVTWNIFGECFIEGKLSKLSQQFHDSTIEKFNYGKISKVVENIFNKMKMEHSFDFNVSFEDLLKIYKLLKKSDPKATKSMDIIFKSMKSKSKKVKNEKVAKDKKKTKEKVIKDKKKTKEKLVKDKKKVNDKL